MMVVDVSTAPGSSARDTSTLKLHLIFIVRFLRAPGAGRGCWPTNFGILTLSVDQTTREAVAFEGACYQGCRGSAAG